MSARYQRGDVAERTLALMLSRPTSMSLRLTTTAAWRAAMPSPELVRLERSALRRFAMAIAATAISVVGAVAIDLPLDVDTNLLLLAAVTISAWYGGRWPGVASALLSAIAMSVLFIPDSAVRVAPGVGEVIYIGAFLAVSIVVSSTSEALHRARRTSESRVHELQVVSARLEAEMEETESLSESLRESNDALTDSLGLAERLAEQALRLQAVTRELSEAKTVDDVTAALLERGIASVGAVAGVVATVDGTAITSRRAAGSEGGATTPSSIDGPADGPLERALRTRQMVTVKSTEEYLAEFPAKFGEPKGASAWLAFTLESRGALVGGLELAFADTHALGQNNVAFAGLLAQAAADSLVRAASFDAERAGRREAELQARTRSEVLGVVAHDLRNPIGIVLASADLLLGIDPPPAQRQQLVEMSQRAAKRMDRLVGDLLDATQLRAGHLSLKQSDVNVCDLLRDAEESWRSAACAAGVILEAHCDASIGVVFADRDRILQAVGNLVGNAIKFSGSAGRVTLTASRTPNQAEILVRDTGPGIPAEVLPRLFDKFWQADVHDRRGIGLGLAITKGIVEAHGGTITVHSEVGRGTTFSIGLPRGRAMSRGGGRAGDAIKATV